MNVACLGGSPRASELTTVHLPTGCHGFKDLHIKYASRSETALIGLIAGIL